MDEGWTVRPRTPVGTESAEPLEPFDIEINSSRTQVDDRLKCAVESYWLSPFIKIFYIINVFYHTFLAKTNVFGEILHQWQEITHSVS